MIYVGIDVAKDKKALKPFSRELYQCQMILLK